MTYSEIFAYSVGNGPLGGDGTQEQAVKIHSGNVSSSDELVYQWLRDLVAKYLADNPPPKRPQGGSR